MATFILTLELRIQPFQENILNKRLEIGRQIYNACLKEMYKRYGLMIESKEFQKIVKMKKGKERNYNLYKLNKKFSLTEYSFHEYSKSMQHHFKKNIDSNTSQKIATRCFDAFKKLMFHESNKVKYKKYGEINSMEGKSNKSGIKFINNKFVWNGLNIDIIKNKNDIYAQMALQNKIKYCRIVRKLIRGKYKFYIQLILDGVPPVKINNETGEIKHLRNDGKVGIDIGTQTIAICSEKDVKLLELAPEVDKNEKQKRILQRKTDRQRRANNPNKYNADGTFKKGNIEKWKNSKNYIKTKNQLAEMQRKINDIRKQSHNKLANWILSLGDDIKVESMSYKGLQKRAKKTTINEKTGKFNKKKRFGKSIGNKSPSMFLTILDNKLKYYNNELKKIDTYLVKASQYNHFTDEYNKKELNERWNDFGEFKIQRDLYSAFLIMNVKDNLKEIDRNLCFEIFGQFKKLHDLEIERLCLSKNIASMGI